MHLGFTSNFSFERGPSNIIPSNAYASAVVKTMAPECFFDARARIYRNHGTPFFNQFYRGHDGEGDEPSDFLKGLMEFANRAEPIQLEKG